MSAKKLDEGKISTNSLTAIVDDCIRMDDVIVPYKVFNFDKTKFINDVLSVLTCIPVDTSTVLWSLKIKDHKYNDLYIQDIIKYIDDVREKDKVFVEWDNEHGCWLWSRKEIKIA